MIALMWCAVAFGQVAHSAIFDSPLAQSRWGEADFVRRLDVDPAHIETVFTMDARDIAPGR